MRQQGKGFESHDGGGANDFIDGRWTRVVVGGRGEFALFDKLARRGAVAMVDAKDVDGEHALHVFFGKVEQGFYLRDAGVGDHAVQVA